MCNPHRPGHIQKVSKIVLPLLLQKHCGESSALYFRFLLLIFISSSNQLKFKQIKYHKALQNILRPERIFAYLKLKGSVGKHQFPQISLKLLQRTRQLASGKHKAPWDFIPCDMVHISLLLRRNRLHKHLLLLFSNFQKHNNQLRFREN